MKTPTYTDTTLKDMRFFSGHSQYKTPSLPRLIASSPDQKENLYLTYDPAVCHHTIN